ncbi:hypothetical protein AMELA_G00038510 [Ameiurus melas]|uniref:Uncharacterized protein n=1 Tax=Ameiurus melas TaxID=219545 RepID=A0A7J6B938_AMEME|nr:hypothetical protein AMELA_G00038510 [Ameiurus melas]
MYMVTGNMEPILGSIGHKARYTLDRHRLPEKMARDLTRMLSRSLTTPVYVFDMLLSARSQSHKAWSRASSSVMPGGAQASRKKGRLFTHTHTHTHARKLGCTKVTAFFPVT